MGLVGALNAPVPVMYIPPAPPVGTSTPSWALPWTGPVLLTNVYFNVTTKTVTGTRTFQVAILTTLGATGTPDFANVGFSAKLGPNITQNQFNAGPGLPYQGEVGSWTAPLPQGPYPGPVTVRIKANGFAATDKIVHVHITYCPLG